MSLVGIMIFSQAGDLDPCNMIGYLSWLAHACHHFDRTSLSVRKNLEKHSGVLLLLPILVIYPIRPPRTRYFPFTAEKSYYIDVNIIPC